MVKGIPLSVYLSWPKPNYIDPAERGTSLVALSSTLVGILVVLVALRYYTRIKVTRWFGSDDVFIGLSLIASFGLTATVTLAYTRYGWNRHVYDIPFSEIPKALKMAMVLKVLFSVAATLTRTSLLCFYMRLLGSAKTTTWTWILWISHFINASIGIVGICLSIFICHPVSAYWQLTLVSLPNCLDEGVTFLTAAILMVIADLLVTLIPIPIVMRLKMPTRRRIAVLALLSLGFVVTGVGCLRTYYIWKWIVSYDLSWTAYPLYVCGTIEVDLGIICACIPTLSPLFTHYLRGRRHSIISNQSSTALQSPTLSKSRVELNRNIYSMPEMMDSNTRLHPLKPSASFQMLEMDSPGTPDTPRWSVENDQELSETAARQAGDRQYVDATAAQAVSGADASGRLPDMV